MSLCALSCDDLLGYNRALAEKWQRWFMPNEAALEAPCDIMNTGTVRLLVQHIFAVELRYAQRLLGDEITQYEQLPIATVAELFAIHTQAAEKYAQFLKIATGPMMDEVLEMQTRSAGMVRASRRTVFVHALLHSVRHWAQLATIVRQAGYPALGWQDYLFFGAVK